MTRAATGLLLAGCLLAGSAASLELSPLEAAGRRLYREGISAAGSPLGARVGHAALLVPGTSVPCANCHGADGKGRPEGGLRPPEITWRELSKPYGHNHDGSRSHPPFDAERFYRALTEGVDPAGQWLNPAMPRFALSRADSAALAAYLQRIEDDHDPGLAAGVLRIATMLPRRGPLAESGRLAEQVLQDVFAQANAGGGVHGRRLELVVIDAADASPLAERLAAADVFAMVGPLATAGAELFALAESAGLPVIGPLAGAGDGGHYTFQLLPGEREQARALAEFAGRRLALDNPETLLVVPTPAAALAGAVETQLARHGWRRISRQAPPAAWEDSVTAWRARGVEVLFFFGSPDEFAALRRSAAAADWSPTILAPAARSGSAEPSPAGALYLAMPALPGDGSPAARQAFEALRREQGWSPRQPGLQAAAYAAASVLLEGLKRVGRVASRERLVEVLENLHAYETGVTPSIAFGPGRRVGVMGAHVLAVDPPTGRLQPVGGFVPVE
ncbi:MAG: ABC transporter substrate-binding protein [Dechloromonas sp.]|nr:ABC transporter substrate-binding protein [Dechloromonas sp.]